MSPWWIAAATTSMRPCHLGTPVARPLRLGVFAALDQRIAVRYHIGPMDLGDSTAYLRHHLALAGRSDQLFADDAIVRLHRQSNGIPRALNNAAVAALIAAARRQGDRRRRLRQEGRRRAHPRRVGRVNARGDGG